MPELPEVETTRRGIAAGLVGQRVAGLAVREPRLRWPIDPELGRILRGQPILGVERRAKYLLLEFPHGTVLFHLGMSGSLRLVDPPPPAPRPHDHVDLELANGTCLRYHDPRRFGCLLWIEGDAGAHPLLRHLGPEPLEAGFDGAHLYRASRVRRSSVKQLIMDGQVVVGVGNIYASEALFLARVDPRRRANRVSLARYGALADAVREVLGLAIAQGGTTLRDYVNGRGVPGYFAQQLSVYGRAGAPCPACGAPIRQLRIAQRSTFFCAHCQR